MARREQFVGWSAGFDAVWRGFFWNLSREPGKAKREGCQTEPRYAYALPRGISFVHVERRRGSEPMNTHDL